jgi:polyhydroxybutyrate depolymerase
MHATLYSKAAAITLVGTCLLIGACGGGNDDGVEPSNADPPAKPPLDRFWVEPASDVTIARGQTISIYAVLQSASDSFPRYQTSTDVRWGISHSSIASIDSDGVVVGLAEGMTSVTAARNNQSASLAITVDGTMQSRSLLVGGQEVRRYSIYTPSALDATTPSPLIVSAHGGGGSAMIQAASTRLNTLAHRERIRIVYLEGSGALQTFNAGACCGFAQANNINDEAYVRAVLDDVQSRFNVDATRVFATGFSNGGMLSHRLACALSDRIAGIAAVGGASGQFDFDRNLYYNCNPTRPIPVLHIHAANDRNYPLAGGFGDGVSGSNYYSVEATLVDWIARNNVTATATLEHVTGTTTCRRYDQSANTAKPSAPVTLCTVDPPDLYDPLTQIVFGGGHSWPGGVRSPSSESDAPATDFDANTYLWRYLNQR